MKSFFVNCTALSRLNRIFGSFHLPSPHLLIAPVMIVLCPFASAGVIYELEFTSEDQSIWAPGGALVKEESVFVGTEWNNKTATIGGIAGSADTVVIPAIDAVKVPIWEPRVWVPTPTWSNPLKGYWTGCGCTKQVQITPAIDAVTADTRTGAKIDVNSSGKVGLEFGYSIDSGSIDTKLDFDVMADLPASAKLGESVNLNTSSVFTNGEIATQSPKIEAYMSAIMELSGSITATACALTFGCKSGSTALPTVDMDQRILSIDPGSLKILDGVMPGGDPLAEVAILNQSLTLEGGATVAPPAVGFKLSGPGGVSLVNTLPPTPSVTVDLAEITANVPDIATEGTGSGDKVTSSGRDDLLSAQLDLDGAATLFGGLPPAGVNVDLIDTPVFKLGASLDLIDVDAGPVLGVTQDFEVTPTLMASLNFSQGVQLAGSTETVTSWTGLWDELPEFSIFGDTEVTPSFWVDVLFKNDLGLDLGLLGTLDILKLGATASIGGIELLEFADLSLNNLLGIDNTLFETDKLGFSVMDFEFGLGGFESFMGDAFTIKLASVPEPSTLALWLSVLFGAGYIRRKRRLSCEHKHPAPGYH